MKAVQLVAPRKFEFVDTDAPTAKPGEVIVKMESLSICGSDLRTYDRILKEEDYPFRLGAPCHECVGVVEETQDERFRRGQRVIAVTNVGGMVEYLAVPGDLCVPVPDKDWDPSNWVLCQPLGTVIHSVQKMGNVYGKTVVILGQGPIGLNFTDLLVRQGAAQVITTDVIDSRLEVSKQRGAVATINPERENVAERVRELTNGAMADIAVDCAGRPSTSHQVFEVLKRQGLVIIFGMTHTEDVFPFDWAMMYSKLPTMIVTNSAVSGDRVDCVKTGVDLVAQGRLDPSYQATHRLPWTRVGDAFELYSTHKDNSLKVIMELG